MTYMKTDIKEKIIEQHSIKCAYCKEIIRGNGKTGAEHNYEAHLWFIHKKENKNG